MTLNFPNTNTSLFALDYYLAVFTTRRYKHLLDKNLVAEVTVHDHEVFRQTYRNYQAFFNPHKIKSVIASLHRLKIEPIGDFAKVDLKYSTIELVRDTYIKHFTYFEKTTLKFNPDSGRVVCLKSAVEKFLTPDENLSQSNTFKLAAHYVNSCFKNQFQSFTSCLAPDATKTSVRVEGDFEVGSPNCMAGAEDIANDFKRSFFDRISNVDIHSLEFQINGPIGKISCDADIDRLGLSDFPKRYHMVRRDQIKVTDGQIKTILSRYSEDSLY